MKRNLFTVFTVAALLSVSAVSQASDVLRFGVDPTFPPFESKNPDGSLTGYDIEMGEALCQQLQAKCEWVETSFDGIIPALKANKFDAILSAMMVNEKRKKQVDFTYELFHGQSFLIARKGALKSADPADLHGKVIGVEQGSLQADYGKVHYVRKGVRVNNYPNSQLMIQDLKMGRIDAVILTKVVADYSLFKKSFGSQFAIVGDELKDASVFGPNYNAIGLRKGDSALQTKLNSALAALRQNGTYQEIYHHYFSGTPSQTDSQ